MKPIRVVVVAVLVILAGVGVAAYRGYFAAFASPEVRTAKVTDGDVLQTVTATGTLQATRTVDVGSQVSGIVKRMFVDYNSIVKQGELIAEIDPSTIEAQLESSKASLDRANIDLAEERVTLASDQRNMERARDLFSHALATEQDREAAELTVKEDEAIVAEDAASARIAEDSVKQSEVDLGYCTIRAPIDGVVITRNADEGQTVTASMTVPSLYILAFDVKTLELMTLVDESDIGKLHPDQDVVFTVSAFPNRQFHGSLGHVRLNTSIVSNVVTYQAVATVPNEDLRLLPGMTAAVKIQIANAPTVVRVPNAAIRFKPTPQVLAAVGQKPAPAPAAPPAAATAVTRAASPTAVVATGATVAIDRLFTGVPRQRSSGEVWKYVDHRLQAVPLELGITDGTWTEVLSGEVQSGDDVITAVAMPAARKK